MMLASCSNYQKILKGNDMNRKFEEAEKYFKKEDYFRSLQLLEELMVVYRGTERGEKVFYYYAYCNYYTGDYVMASYHFNNFLMTYPNSSYSEEVQYMYAYCSYLESPVSSLDQTSSVEAIEKFQLFINRYPQSPRVAEANNLIDELRMKLETKAFNNARLYYRTENYKAAVSALQNVLIDYPATVYKEEILFLTFKSAYLYAEGSIEGKQLQRMKDAKEHYLKLIDSYPESQYVKEAERIYNNLLDDIRKKDPVSLN